MSGWAMVDKIESIEPGVRAVAIKTFLPDTFFFAQHFPGYPTLPGVLEIEMIAQTAFACIRQTRPDAFSMLTHVRSARFFNRIGPNDRCVITSDIIQLRPRHALIKGRIEVEGVKAGDAEILLAILPIENTAVDPAAMMAFRSYL